MLHRKFSSDRLFLSGTPYLDLEVDPVDVDITRLVVVVVHGVPSSQRSSRSDGMPPNKINVYIHELAFVTGVIPPVVELRRPQEDW